MGLLIAVLMSAESGEVDQRLERREPLVLAARYQLRSRTSNFYSRAQPGGNPQNNVRK